MKKIKGLAAMATVALIFSSCAMSRNAPLTGFLYTSTKSPMAVTNNAGASKVGTSEAMSILGWVATGDASIDAACKAGGVTKIHHVDEECTGILGIIAKYKVYVYGE
ncbi:MAG TPA: TRL-like family protein [Bacteroidia bacterium]|nr:TRL-like family protein [Bacteroidia bacterium]